MDAARQCIVCVCVCVCVCVRVCMCVQTSHRTVSIKSCTGRVLIIDTLAVWEKIIYYSSLFIIHLPAHHVKWHMIVHDFVYTVPCTRIYNSAGLDVNCSNDKHQ